MVNEILGRLLIALDKHGLRERGGIAKLARLTGYSEGQISNVLNGKSKLVERFIDTIATKLQINKQWLLTGEGEMSSKPRIPSIGDPIEPIWHPHGTVPSIGDFSEGTKGTKPHIPAIGDADLSQQEKYAFAIIRNSQGWDAEEIVRSLTKLPRSVRSRIISQMFEAIEKEDERKKQEEAE